jgi:hypothetical protein
MIDPFPTASGGSHGHKGSPQGKGSKGSPKKKEAQKPSLKAIEFTKYVYPDCKMQNSKKPPSMIYLPTSDIMRKMIKACMKVDSVAEIQAKF